MTFSKVITSIVALVGLTLLQDSICAKKEHRAKMALLVPVVIIYAVCATFALTKLYTKIEPYLQDYGLISYAIIVANTILILGYILVKLIIGNLLKKKWEKHSQISMTSSFAYSYAEEYDTWFLQYRWVNYRSVLCAIRWGIVIVSAISMSIINTAEGVESLTWTFPYIIAIIFNELYFFFNGQTKKEFEHSILGTEADSRRVGAYFRIREIFEKLFPEPLLSAQTGFESAGKKTPIDYVEKLSKSSDKIDRLTAEYFIADDKYMSAESDGVKATLDLMHRKNVVFFNPFYRDLNMYFTLPLVHTLVSGKKCVVITGRMSSKEDVKMWLTDLLGEYTHMPSLWKVDDIKSSESNCEVGIIGFPELYDNDVITENKEFLQQTDLVLLIEPSTILSTGQVALSIISQEFGMDNQKPVYFVCDRMVDGLVDTISHLLRTEFADVEAPPVPRCAYTGIGWDANGDFSRQQFFDKQTKYLGNGTELAAVAVKNQIPHVTWYGETKVPIRDVKWIVGQYYPVICQYMNQPSQQNTIYEKLDFISNLWSAPKKKEQFSIVEDEFNNMFSTMRTFLSRGNDQSFVNVLSENYLLRDYMRCNQQMFLANPNAIPSFVPDYAKTERNTLIKLILLMTYRQVSEKEIIDEFHLVGVECDNAYDLMSQMLSKYTNADRSVLEIETVDYEIDELTKGKLSLYSITKDSFRKYFKKSLAKAYYLLEEERSEEKYVDAKFFSHVTQNIVQGQFVTYDGKYYQVKHVSPYSGVVLRRASDLFDDRRYYRQVRRYTLPDGNEEVISSRTVMDLEISFVQRDIHVSTDGYLDMNDLHDLRTARLVDITSDPHIDDYHREFRNKTLMRIKLPEANDDIRFTLCLLLSEAFRSMFPDGYPYIAVTTKCSEKIEGMLSKIVYPVDGDIEDEYIYIIEDSDIDLGLLEAIDRNLMKIFDVVGDYLKWHFEKMREPEMKDPIPPSYNYDKEKEEQKKQSVFAKMANRIRKLMGGKREDPISLDFNTEATAKHSTEEEYTDAKNEKSKASIEKEIEREAIDEDIQGEENLSNTSLYDSEHTNVLTNHDDRPHEITDVDGTDIFDESGEVEDNLIFELEFKAQGLMPITRTRYQRECFLKFGFDEIDKRIHVEDLMKYLRVHGWTNNALTQARKRDAFEKSTLDLEAENHCDFCGRPLSGASYELLNDGRIRCNDCSASSIATVEDLRELFYQTLELMEAFYGIKYRVPINVNMVDARTVAKGAGMVFKPSTEMTARVLGFAQMKRGRYSLVMENGSPRLAALDTMVHEMTHIWQYINWDMDLVKRIFNMGDDRLNKIAVDIVYEGMSVWAAIQYLYQIGETQYAMQMEKVAENRSDVYGWGFRLYREQYPLTKDASLIKLTPYNAFPTLDPTRVMEFILDLINGASQNEKNQDEHSVAEQPEQSEEVQTEVSNDEEEKTILAEGEENNPAVAEDAIVNDEVDDFSEEENTEDNESQVIGSDIVEVNKNTDDSSENLEGSEKNSNEDETLAVNSEEGEQSEETTVRTDD